MSEIAAAPPCRCPLYGYTAFPSVRLLVASDGNQCPLYLHSFTPCQMERKGQAPNLDACPLAPQVPAGFLLDLLQFRKHEWSRA
jgi:hypothetical protein